MTAVVDDALDALERRVFFEAFNHRYGELREDEDGWAENKRAADRRSLSRRTH